MVALNILKSIGNFGIKSRDETVILIANEAEFQLNPSAYGVGALLISHLGGCSGTDLAVVVRDVRPALQKAVDSAISICCQSASGGSGIHQVLQYPVDVSLIFTAIAVFVYIAEP